MLERGVIFTFQLMVIQFFFILFGSFFHFVLKPDRSFWLLQIRTFWNVLEHGVILTFQLMLFPNRLSAFWGFFWLIFSLFLWLVPSDIFGTYFWNMRRDSPSVVAVPGCGTWPRASTGGWAVDRPGPAPTHSILQTNYQPFSKKRKTR